VGDRATLLRGERGHVRGQREVDGRAYVRVERGVLGWRDLVEPVACGAPAVTALEHAVEQVLGRSVHDDA
jgi:hypothetical protein